MAKTNKKKSQRNSDQKRTKKFSLSDAQQFFRITCKHCGRKNDIHAYGRNKRLAEIHKSTKPIISSACWNETCKLRGQEVQEIDHRG